MLVAAVLGVGQGRRPALLSRRREGVELRMPRRLAWEAQWWEAALWDVVGGPRLRSMRRRMGSVKHRASERGPRGGEVTPTPQPRERRATAGRSGEHAV